MKPPEIVTACYAAGEAGDLEAIAGFFAEHAVWDNRISDDPMGGVYDGLASIRAGLLEPLFSFLPDGIKTEIERVVESGDTVLCLNTGRGTTIQGEAFEKQYAHIFDCSDGKIVRVTEFRS